MEVYLGIVVAVVILWLWWRWQRISVFSNLGIPGPKPSLIFGNILELYRKGPLQCQEEWVKEHGRILGYYHGMKPILLVADPQMLKNIFIKDFSKFLNRVSFNPLHKYRADEPNDQSVLNVQGQKWKEIRSVLTPTFTAVKMKQMAVSMNHSIETMLELMFKKAKKGEVINIHDAYQRLTMDVISKTAFGVAIDIQDNPDSKILKATQILFITPYYDPIIFIGLCFPFLRRLCLKLQTIVLAVLNRGKRPIILLRKGLNQVLQQRRDNPKAKKADLLQLMLDAKISDTGEEVDVRKLEIGDAEIEREVENENTTNKATRSMTSDEIVASSVTVLLAGYETTSTALAFTTYLLAKHKDIQEKAFLEIDELVQSGQTLEYATVNKLPYLDHVLNESMRLYPPVYLFTNRYAIEDVRYGDMLIPKGMMVQAAVHLLHHDPEFWEEPEEFRPERFESKPNSDGISYLPFGVGPRNCLGMRFAQMEAKLALASILHKFRIIPVTGPKMNLEVDVRIRTLTPKHGVHVKLEQREQGD